jgi:hypothetical protein
MIDLDALSPATESVKLGGKEYQIPRGFRGIPLRALPLGQELAPIFQRLEKDPQALSESDVQTMIRFISLATSIPEESLAALPFAVIQAILTTLSGGAEAQQEAAG